MKVEEIISLWDCDCKIDETELGDESTKIPVLHNKYMKIFMAERVQLLKMKSQLKKLKAKLISYYNGELDQDELEEFGREQFYKKVLKNEIEIYVESDDDFIELNIKVALQQEKVDYVEQIIRSINNRGFQIKNAIEWMRFTTG